MAIAALITWIVTAGGGFILLGQWLQRGGLRQQAGGTTSFKSGLIFGHFLLAAAGLVLWLIYVVTDTEGLAWLSFAVLVVVALLGATMFVRWLGVRRGAATTVSAGTGTPSGAAQTGDEPAERGLPVPIVALHGAVAVVTAVLVLLASLGVGGD
ncbi:MAG TPA: hypothetical protein VFU43_12860 [Streptosporangiaceae bacterium]|nr:hypothetical protein [Streptosporangiaceae bacterium]